MSAAVNEAYNTLRDPFLRAEHLLAMEGGPTAAEQKQVPPAFLAEMLDAREELERAKGHAAETARLADAFAAHYDGLMAEVAGLFDQLGREAPGEGRANLLGRVRGLLNAAKYVRGLIRDLESE